MAGRIIRLPDFRIDRNGKIVRNPKRLPLPARIARHQKVRVKNGR
jgi:hypothetical protein